MVKTNQDINNEQNYYWWRKEKSLEKLSWEAFEHRLCIGQESFSQADKITSIPCSIEKDMVNESISKIRNGKTAELSGVVSEMVKTAREAGVEIT